MIKLRSKRFCRGSFKLGGNGGGNATVKGNEKGPVVALTMWHDISIEATSTFGELKMVLSLVTSLEPEEQRLLFKGKERDSGEYLHMVGVKTRTRFSCWKIQQSKKGSFMAWQEANPSGLLVVP
ncbi:protein binding protein [Salix suchowensis]|nr:protein binding protein [Salix suchowensis]